MVTGNWCVRSYVSYVYRNIVCMQVRLSEPYSARPAQTVREPGGQTQSDTVTQTTPCLVLNIIITVDTRQTRNSHNPLPPLVSI